MKRTSVQMTVSLPPELFKKAVRIAKKEIRSQSELVREALRDYIAKKEEIAGARNKLMRSLEKKGIRTMEDIERMIDEGRN